MALDEAAFGASPAYEPPGRRGKFRFLTYPFRFFFRLFKRSIAAALRAVAFHPVGSLVFLVLLAAVGFLGYQDLSGGRLRLGPGGGGSASEASLPPSPATEDFIKGQTTFNAQLMWSSFSEPLKQQLTQRGTNQQTLQRQLDQRKQAGAKVDDVQYIGGAPQADGSRVFVYILTVEGPAAQGNQPAPQPQHYVLTVDQTDKIIKVE